MIPQNSYKKGLSQGFLWTLIWYWIQQKVDENTKLSHWIDPELCWTIHDKEKAAGWWTANWAVCCFNREYSLHVLYSSSYLLQNAVFQTRYCRKSNCARIPISTKKHAHMREPMSQRKTIASHRRRRSITVGGTWFACSYFFPLLSGEHKDHLESSGHCPISVSYCR